MTREEFIEVLNREEYSYEIQGDKIVVTDKEAVHLAGSSFTKEGEVYIEIIYSIPDGVIFKNSGLLNLSSLEKIPEDVEFRNTGDLWLSGISTSEIPPGFLFKNAGSINFSNEHWNHEWSGNIEGINDKRLMDLMIKHGMF
jgi:hypothetical protein